MAAGRGKQIVNGVRLTGIGFAALLLVFVLIDGIGRIVSSLETKNVSAEGIAGWGELAGVGTVLFITASVWSKWVASVAILGALKSFIGLVAGSTVALPFRPISRLVAGETLVFFLAVALLAMRFSLNGPGLSEKIALLVVVFAACFDMLFEPQPLALALGVGALLLTRVGTALILKWRERDHPGGPVAARHR